MRNWSWSGSILRGRRSWTLLLARSLGWLQTLSVVCLDAACQFVWIVLAVRLVRFGNVSSRDLDV